jgi:hypothetical protein
LDQKELADYQNKWVDDVKEQVAKFKAGKISKYSILIKEDGKDY